MTTVHVRRSIHAPAGEVWQVLRSFRLDYFPGFAHTVTGSGVGAARTFRLPDGEMTEQIEAFDDRGMRLAYIIVEGPWRVREYHATVQVNAAGEGCEVEWMATFKPDGVEEAAAVELVEGTFGRNLRSLEKFVAGV
jgi:hypothetical protein